MSNYIIMETCAGFAQSKLITLCKEDKAQNKTVPAMIEARMAELKPLKLTEEQIKASSKKRAAGILKFMGAPVYDKISGEIYYIYVDEKGNQTYVSEYFYLKKMEGKE